ncbi:MAG: hypothetical protein FWG26_00240 [Betaproteobacteria bacterium]|jgi:hypothetical protein|nr:hypothetical protein [Betaproteobacteria bacterium]
MMTEEEKREYFEKDIWVDVEVVSLLHGVCPNWTNEEVERAFNDIGNAKKLSFKQVMQRTLNEINFAVGAKLLTTKVAIVDTGDRFDAYIPKEVIEWARRKLYTYPNFPFHTDPSPVSQPVTEEESDTANDAAGKAVIESLPTETASPSDETKVQTRKRWILERIMALGHDPKALPKNPPGKCGIKAELRKQTDRQMFTDSTFDTTWKRLRADGEIVNK